MDKTPPPTEQTSNYPADLSNSGGTNNQYPPSENISQRRVTTEDKGARSRSFASQNNSLKETSDNSPLRVLQRKTKLIGRAKN